MNERIKELGNILWDSVIRFSATQESVTEMIRIAYEEGKAARPDGLSAPRLHQEPVDKSGENAA